MTDEAPERAPASSSPLGSSRRKLSRKTILVLGGMLVLCAIIAIDVAVIADASSKRPVEPAATPAVVPSSPAVAPSAPASAPAEAGEQPPDSSESFVDFPSETAPSLAHAEPRFATVKEAADRACSTSSVEGLSRQIIAQTHCIDPRAFAAVPSRANLVAGKQVALYLHASARDHLLKVLDAHRSQTLTVNSALRTVAQQYLVSRWGAGKRCGVQLAAQPGESNHETGFALDVADPMSWRAALEKEGFEWMGAIDRVHFDYGGKGAVGGSRIDIRAFQQLWNRNHPEDLIRESGHYDSATEQRLKKAPAAGFKQGARCDKASGSRK